MEEHHEAEPRVGVALHMTLDQALEIAENALHEKRLRIPVSERPEIYIALARLGKLRETTKR